MSDAIPVCCYCDAPLSCARCGCEQPADDVSILKSRVEELEACTALATFNEACKRIEELEAALREIMEEPYHDVASIARYALAGGGVLEKARAALVQHPGQHADQRQGEQPEPDHKR